MIGPRLQYIERTWLAGCEVSRHGWFLRAFYVRAHMAFRILDLSNAPIVTLKEGRNAIFRHVEGINFQNLPYLSVVLTAPQTPQLLGDGTSCRADLPFKLCPHPNGSTPH